MDIWGEEKVRHKNGPKTRGKKSTDILERKKAGK